MNLLSNETSPYLLQHAENPVCWMPWSETALQIAREQNKPILLSVGYSACHWCHVMAHESFEDPATAEIMNTLFINVKVDREERPDLDKIYQMAHSVLTERPGGWPLTVFIDPRDHMPIYAGTYFPDKPRHGLPSFSQLLRHVSDIYQTRQDDITRQSDSIRAILCKPLEATIPESLSLSAMPLDMARTQIEQQFDARYGGYSKAPKFPHPAIIERAMRHWYQTASNLSPDARLLHTALFSLERMSEGGLFDHLGGGFFRYSTDEKWMIPHFEKMLYDNGPLLWLNVQAWCLSKNPLYMYAASETAHWIMREMQAEDGGYYSALDADSEGVEGKFYVWQKPQIEDQLSDDDAELVIQRFGLDRAANFEGQWHLHAYLSEHQIADAFRLDDEQCHARLQQSRQSLLQLRQQRVRPGLDDKILTSWNALVIAAMAYAGRQLGQDDFFQSAQRAASFIKQHHWRDDRLLATSRRGQAHLNAYLDDYAFLLHALLELLQHDWSNEHYHWAIQLADTLLDQFEDSEHGGFFFTSHDHEQLIQRSKSFADEAIPSGNGIAALALQRLGYLSGDTRYLTAAENSLKCAWQSINQHAISHCTMLHALEEYLQPPQIIVLRGQQDKLGDWQRYSRGHYLPSTMIFAIADHIETPDFATGKTTIGTACAYPCSGLNCQPPITSFEAYQHHLDKRFQSVTLDSR